MAHKKWVEDEITEALTVNLRFCNYIYKEYWKTLDSDIGFPSEDPLLCNTVISKAFDIFQSDLYYFIKILNDRYILRDFILTF